MNQTRTLLGAAVILALGAGGGWWFGQRAAHPATGSLTTAPAIVPAIERAVLYWYDPMVPGQKFDQPGRSPFMDMDLVPKYADEGGAAGSVVINPRVVQNLGIRTAEAVSGSLEQKVTAVGAVAYNERATVVVAPRANAFVEKLYVRAPLDTVRKGQPLVELLIPEWTGAQAEYLLLRDSKLAGADDLKKAARERLLLLGMSEAQIAQVEKTGKPAPRLTLASPIDGVVAELGVREGMTLPQGTALYRLVDLATVWVNAEVPEAQAAWVKPGAPVEATVPAYPGEVFKGKIAALLPEIDPATRTIKARIELANRGAQLKPGMFATLQLADARGKTAPAVLVPSEAVIRTGTRTLVMLAEGEGKYRQVEVKTGGESGGQTEILKGLLPGNKVIVSGQFLVDSEASLRAEGLRTRDGEGSEPRHTAEGVIEAIDGDELTISHGAIASARMGAMTMSFKAPKNTKPGATVKVGERIRYEFAIEKNGDFQIVKIEPLVAAASTSNTPVKAVIKLAPEPQTALTVHHAEGEIVAADSSSLLIKHGPVASAGMGAMTMEFLAPKTLPAGLKKGDRVRFDFTASPAGEYRALKVERAAP
ncbi:MAG: efflux RND transporter periplasmic adaptor subunit [Burkholderiaceae bacterium]